jgi:ribosomal protein S18 acetylase RimI-like enzyme
MTTHPNPITIRSFEPGDRAAVIRLWIETGLVVPWNDPDRDIDIKLTQQPELFLVGEENGRLVAAAMAGFDGHRGWINYLAVAPDRQGAGYGEAMVIEAEQRLKRLGCPKINLQVRASNTRVIGFYEHLGYKQDEVISLGKRLT